jgi:hypothetical protein
MASCCTGLGSASGVPINKAILGVEERAMLVVIRERHSMHQSPIRSKARSYKWASDSFVRSDLSLMELDVDGRPAATCLKIPHFLYPCDLDRVTARGEHWGFDSGDYRTVPVITLVQVRLPRKSSMRLDVSLGRLG